VDADATFPITMSLQVAGLALACITPVGLGLALVQARRRYRLRGLVDALILLPLVLPPSVVGYFLVLLFGRRGVLGHALEQGLGIRFVFSPAGAVLASAVVALPILVKTAQPSIEAVPRDLIDVARSLGLSPAEVLVRVTLPLAWRGVLSALVLAFARAIGEFGATLMLAGNIPGKTTTMPIAIYAAYEAGDDRQAIVYVTVLSAISTAVVLLASRLSPRDVTA
jgi:molybdate transport system permease protein